MSFFFLSQSFFIDREENHLFVNVVLSFVVVYIFLYILPVLEKKRSSLKFLGDKKDQRKVFMWKFGKLTQYFCIKSIF